MPPILYLIDGHALAYRAYFALSSTGGGRWTNSKGEPTAGTYGFTAAILKLLEKEQPEYLAVAFDTGRTFRDDIFEEYKATREKMPDDLRPQMNRIRQIVDAFGFPRLELEGFEADDILGTIAVNAVEKGFGVKIITGDRDLLQLVNDRIIVNLPDRKSSDTKDYSRNDVFEYLGVYPEQVVDYKSLVGDTSDNIPGIRGIGEKTAVKLLLDHTTLEGIYTHIDQVSPRIRTLLEQGVESGRISHQLALIRTDAPIQLELEKARTAHINYNELGNIFQELEFRTMIPRLQSISGVRSITKASPSQPSLFGEPVTQLGHVQPTEITTHIIDTETGLADLVKTLKKAKTISFDTETTSTDPMQADLVGISLAVNPDEGYYIPVGHHTNRPQLPLETIQLALGKYFQDQKISKVGHNMKYDGLVLGQHGMPVNGYDFDTMVAGWLIDPASRRLGLKEMAEQFLNLEMTHIESLIGSGKNQRSMADVPVEEAAPYATADAVVPLRLQPLLMEKLNAYNAAALMKDMEMPLIPVLIEMETNGISLDPTLFSEMGRELNQRMEQIEKHIYEAVGKTFNINSTQQLSDILFNVLKIIPPKGAKKTASGLFSTSADVLEELSGTHPVVDMILEYRELSKLNSTYVDALPRQVNPRTGKVHTSFNQTGSVTGRLASSNPNLQNIPTRTEIGNRVRQGFTASPGLILLAVDYSQIELRIVAHMSGDKAMLNAFSAGQDIHAATAAAINHIPLEAVTKDQRRRAKAINFGLIYGMSAFGLTRTTDLTLAEAENFVNAYFQQFPGVKEYLYSIRKGAVEKGYVETLFGRRRYFNNLTNSNMNVRNREEREAINAPIQGTAADIIKIAMRNLLPTLKKDNLRAKLLLQVHDELILECPEEELKPTSQVVKRVMESACTLSIPLLTEARWGKNWGSLTSLQG